MNLKQLRTQLMKMSGRFDLINPDGSDNGADFYINAGQRYLDRLDETQKSWATAYRIAKAGMYSVQFPFCRAIKEIYAATASARWQLEKMKLQDMITEYLTATPEQLDTGNPLYYSPIVTRAAPETFNQPADTFESFIGYIEVMSGNHFGYNAVIVSPTPSEDMLIQINGLFYSDELSEDTDISYWSSVHPELLIMATMLELEIVNRNTQGANDWRGAIMEHVSKVGMDLVEEIIAEADQMEG